MCSIVTLCILLNFVFVKWKKEQFTGRVKMLHDHSRPEDLTTFSQCESARRRCARCGYRQGGPTSADRSPSSPPPTRGRRELGRQRGWTPAPCRLRTSAGLCKQMELSYNQSIPIREQLYRITIRYNLLGPDLGLTEAALLWPRWRLWPSCVAVTVARSMVPAIRMLSRGRYL